ncbi:MAG TPA: hypothetical protein VEL76_12100 [Gemmataceae bacterium]|nr:hypothetical protein [Gemmataceae bacterium]
MTEQEWFECADVESMVRSLPAKVSERKRRLFGCACCRQVPSLFRDKQVVKALEAAEKFADRRVVQATCARWIRVVRKLEATFPPAPNGYAWQMAYAAVCSTLHHAAYGSVYYFIIAAAEAAKLKIHPLAELLRDIVSNPWRPRPRRSFPDHILGLAENCYAAFPEISDEYLILADALDELGEVQAAEHCRQGQHARGCHILDWILRKK